MSHSTIKNWKRFLYLYSRAPQSESSDFGRCQKTNFLASQFRQFRLQTFGTSVQVWDAQNIRKPNEIVQISDKCRKIKPLDNQTKVVCPKSENVRISALYCKWMGWQKTKMLPKAEDLKMWPFFLRKTVILAWHLGEGGQKNVQIWLMSLMDDP